jgi:hypothetical protein
VTEAPKFALARILSSPKPALDQCDLFDAIEHIRSIPTTVTVIVEEEEEGEDVIGEGEEVALQEQKEEEPAKEKPEEEEVAQEEPTQPMAQEEPRNVAAPPSKNKWFADGEEQDSTGGVEHERAENGYGEDHTQKALANEPIPVNEGANKDCLYCDAKLPAVAKFCFSCGEKQDKEEVASEDYMEKKEIAPPSEEQVAAKDDTEKDTTPLEQQHVAVEVGKKKKLVQRQEERYYFMIKTESKKFFLECGTAVELEAWLEAWERVLVQTRSRQHRNRERGWQHALVQTSLYSAAITGLDDLCSKQWLDAKNELDKYNSLSPLHYAVMVNHMHIMDFLLSHGADPEVQDAEERTPMYYGKTVLARVFRRRSCIQGSYSSFVVVTYC